MKKRCRPLTWSALVGNNLLLCESLLKRPHNHRQMFSLLLLPLHERRQRHPPGPVWPHVGKLQLGSSRGLVQKLRGILWAMFTKNPNSGHVWQRSPLRCPRAPRGRERSEPLPWWGDAGGCTRLNTAFRCKLLSSTLDVAAHCDGQAGEDVSDFYKLPWLKDKQRNPKGWAGLGWGKLHGGGCGSPRSRRRLQSRVGCCAWGCYMLVLQRNDFKAFPTSRRVRCSREMLCYPGLCRVGAGGTAGRDVRFASAGSGEPAPGGTFLLGGREHLGSSLCAWWALGRLSVGTKTALAAFDSYKQKQDVCGLTEMSQACAFSWRVKDA